MSWEDLQGEACDAKRSAEELVSHLECAETCESKKDFLANLRNAEEKAQEVLDAIVATLEELDQ